MLNSILLAIYPHPEAYPPTLSAIDQLSECTRKLDVVCRNTMASKWKYPSNVTMHYTTGKPYEGFGIEKISLLRKVWHFLAFTLKIRSLILKNKPEYLLVYDVIPLWSAWLIKSLLKQKGTLLWYHNHDTTDIKKTGKYSVTGLASRFERRSFKLIRIFSLPARERLVHFPLNSDHKVFIIPNYPLKKFYGSAFISPEQKEPGKLKLVFQGSIGPGHGLEEIIPLLGHKINGKKVELHLVGKVRPAYREKLSELVQNLQVTEHFYYHGLLPFPELPRFLSPFHVGLAIHQPYNVTYSTGGSASNKIYEYAACGLPVILFDLPHYREYLGEYPWAFFTDLKADSLLHSWTEIDNNYQRLSLAASESFRKTNHFETAFLEVKKFLRAAVNGHSIVIQ